MEMEKEEGEMSDDNAMLVDDNEPIVSVEKNIKHTTVRSITNLLCAILSYIKYSTLLQYNAGGHTVLRLFA